jgi:muconolactone delta-isomerase
MRSMVTIQLDLQQHGEEINALVPQERSHVSNLLSKGIMEAFYMSARRDGRFWLVIKGESEEQIEQELKAFPLYPYMKLEFIPLVDANPAQQ